MLHLKCSTPTIRSACYIYHGGRSADILRVCSMAIAWKKWEIARLTTPMKTLKDPDHRHPLPPLSSPPPLSLWIPPWTPDNFTWMWRTIRKRRVSSCFAILRTRVSSCLAHPACPAWPSWFAWSACPSCCSSCSCSSCCSCPSSCCSSLFFLFFLFFSALIRFLVVLLPGRGVASTQIYGKRKGDCDVKKTLRMLQVTTGMWCRQVKSVHYPC